MLTTLLMLTLLAQAPGSVPAIRVTSSTVGHVDMAALKGRPWQLAWSPDGSQLYLQTVELDKDNNVKASYHYLIPAAGGDAKPVDAEPAWAQEYWDWKSGRLSPDDEKVAIELETTTKQVTATSAPMGGDYARGGTSTDGRTAGQGASMDSMVAVTQQQQKVQVNSLKLKGETIGVWENERPIPGITFGWAPKGANLIAYAEKNNGALMFMDKTGTKKKIDGTRDVVLPAFSDDASHIAYLQNLGKGKFAVVVGSIAR